MVVLLNQGLMVGKEWNSNAGFSDANLMLLTAILNSCLVLDGGVQDCGLWFLLSALWRVGGWERYCSSQLGGTHGANLVARALFTECPRARAPTLLVVLWDSPHNCFPMVPWAVSLSPPAGISPLSQGSLALGVSSRT